MAEFGKELILEVSTIVAAPTITNFYQPGALQKRLWRLGIALPASRIVGLALEALVIAAAVVTVLRHRDLVHLAPLGVFVTLIALAATLS